jgi:hypothetical protein
MVSGQIETKRHKRFRVGAMLLASLTILSAVLGLSTRRLNDPPSYIAFADQRTFLGVPRFMDVISSLPWAVVGVAGVISAWRRKPGPHGPFSESWERLGSMVLFAAILGVSIGSTSFHYAPGPTTLLWDRLPIAVAFMCFLALVIGDRISLRCGRALFWPLVAFGLFSVWHWQYTETLGRGDIRLYALVQLYPMLAVPCMLVAFPARYTRAGDTWLALLCYGLAKLFELGDAGVFALTKVISGHTLKHLAATFATLLLLRFVQQRRQIHGECR